MIRKTSYKAETYSAETDYGAVRRQPDFSKRKQTNTSNRAKLQRLPASLPALHAEIKTQSAHQTPPGSAI